nr:nucleotide-binding alpha-beta plait domain-containing protein [Tanacetum cinerariifolium]
KELSIAFPELVRSIAQCFHYFVWSFPLRAKLSFPLSYAWPTSLFWYTRRAGGGLVDVAAYNTSTKANYVSAINALRAIDFPLLIQLESQKMQVWLILWIFFIWKVLLLRLWRLANCSPHLSNLCFPFTDWRTKWLSLSNALVRLVEPLSAKNLVGEASTSGVPAVVTTIALSTTFIQASFIPPIPLVDDGALGAERGNFSRLLRTQSSIIHQWYWRNEARLNECSRQGNEEDGPDSRAHGDRFYNNRRSVDRGNEKVDRNPGNISEIKGLWRRVQDLEIQHKIRQIRKRIRELELQREMRMETESRYVVRDDVNEEEEYPSFDSYPRSFEPIYPDIFSEDEPMFDEEEVVNADYEEAPIFDDDPYEAETKNIFAQQYIQAKLSTDEILDKPIETPQLQKLD